MEKIFKQQGTPSWCELLTSDVAGAKSLYGELLGWTMEDMAMSGMTYTVIKTGGREIGGLMAPPPQAKGAPPHWGIYITVDDVGACARKALALGGKVLVPPTDIPQVGRFCLIQDPQGAALSLITYLEG